MSRSFHLLISRKSLPTSLGIFVVLVFFWQHLSHSRADNIAALFSNLMALLSIFSGFIASFYFFVATRGSNFLAKIERTATFEALLKLTKVSLEFSFVNIVYVFFMAGYAPIFSGEHWWNLRSGDVFVAVGFFLTGVTISNFVRCMRLFLKLSGANP